MKSFRPIFALAAAAGTLLTSMPCAWSQSPQNANPQAAAISPNCQLINEALSVQDALNRFNSALAAHDIDQMQAAGIEAASAKGWQRFFKENPSATISDRCSGSDLSISGDTASWSCTETSTLVSQGKPVQYAHNIRFTFTRKNGSWTISDRK
jgi:hypothetical protein